MLFRSIIKVFGEHVKKVEEAGLLPKIKTVRGAAKRFKKTGKGGFKHKHANLRHILTKKATKRKRHLRPKAMVSKGDLGLVVACLPYA